MALFLISLVRRHFLSFWLPVPNNTGSTLDTVCALDKILLLQDKRFNHQEERCGTKGEPFTFFLQFTKKNVFQNVSQAPIHIAESTLISQAFLRNFSNSTAKDSGKSSRDNKADKAKEVEQVFMRSPSTLL